ncbi:MAG: HAD family hydrolase [Anaerolineaceae bacterium]|nr:HAD family hydrolase [Anaerolineaceae bacterium]
MSSHSGYFQQYSRMTKKIAVLFDLDDTLLGNNMDNFLPGYLNALSQAVPEVSSNKLITTLLAGTRKMLTKTMPENTLEEVFNDYFYPGIGVSKDKLENKIAAFYKYDFPSLKSLTQTKNESLNIVAQIKKRGHSITIATNPLFPSAAQYHRVEWAGFNNTNGIFDDVTSFENYHFCKPYPEYYSEIILKNGYSNMPVVMIGNSYSDDILPAEKLGISTYWITANEQKQHQQGEFSTAGNLSGVLDWLDSIENKISPIQWNNSLENSITMLKTTPAIFESFYAKYPQTQLMDKPNKSEWSVFDTLRHVLEGDKQLNIARIRQFFNETKVSSQ